MTTGLVNLSAPSSVGLSGFSAPSATEQAVQAAGYLGYLDLLLSSPTPPATEVTRVVGILNQLKTSVTDSTVQPILTAGLAAYATSASAYRSWWVTPTDSKGDTNATALLTWLSSSTVKKNFQSSDAHSDTEFALLMLLCDSQSYTAGQIGLSSAVDSFFGQTLLSGNATGVMSDFLNAYLSQVSGGLSLSSLTALLPQDSSKSMPNYDLFLSNLKNASTMPSFNDAAGIVAYWFTPVASRFFTNLF